jgi:hypothetical protein
VLRQFDAVSIASRAPIALTEGVVGLAVRLAMGFLKSLGRVAGSPPQAPRGVGRSGTRRR